MLPSERPEARNLKTKFLKLVAKQVPGPARCFFSRKTVGWCKRRAEKGLVLENTSI